MLKALMVLPILNTSLNMRIGILFISDQYLSLKTSVDPDLLATTMTKLP